MRFWLKTTRPNVGLWKNLPLGPLGLILGATILSSVTLGGVQTAGFVSSASAEGANVEAPGELATTAVSADSSIYIAADEAGVKSDQVRIALGDKSSLIASPSPTKLARRK